jgi:hypothetical protein
MTLHKVDGRRSTVERFQQGGVFHGYNHGFVAVAAHADAFALGGVFDSVIEGESRSLSASLRAGSRLVPRLFSRRSLRMTSQKSTVCGRWQKQVR